MNIKEEIQNLKKDYGYTEKEIQTFIQHEIAECNGLIDEEVAITLIKKKIGCKDKNDHPLLAPPKKEKFKAELLPPLSQNYKDSIWDENPYLYAMDSDKSVTTEEFDTNLCRIYLNDFVCTEKIEERDKFENRIAVKCPQCYKLMRHDGYGGKTDEFGNWILFECRECKIELKITTQFEDFL
jgi:hypothetical protein